MLGLSMVDRNEAIVVRTTMVSERLGISPDAILREMAYSPGHCFGKGERKYRFKVAGGVQQANCLGVYLCCLPATLKQELKTLLEGTQLRVYVSSDIQWCREWHTVVCMCSECTLSTCTPLYAAHHCMPLSHHSLYAHTVLCMCCSEWHTLSLL